MFTFIFMLSDGINTQEISVLFLKSAVLSDFHYMQLLQYPSLEMFATRKNGRKMEMPLQMFFHFMDYAFSEHGSWCWDHLVTSWAMILFLNLSYIFSQSFPVVFPSHLWPSQSNKEFTSSEALQFTCYAFKVGGRIKILFSEEVILSVHILSFCLCLLSKKTIHWKIPVWCTSVFPQIKPTGYQLTYSYTWTVNINHTEHVDM